MHARAAAQQRPQLHARPDAQAAGALRPHQTLVAGKAEHINAHFLHIDQCCPGGLRGVDYQKRTMRVRHCADPGNIEHISGQIGGVSADDRLCVRAEQRLHVLVSDVSAAIRADKIDRRTARLHIVQRAQYGIMLEIGRNDVIARRNQSVDRDIQRLSRVCRENDMVGARTAEQLRQSAPRLEYHARRRQRRAVRAPRGIPGGQYRVFHRLGNLRRLVQRCRRIIQIDHVCLHLSAVHLDDRVRFVAAACLCQSRKELRPFVDLRLPCETAAGADLRRDGDHAPGQAAVRKQRLCGKRLLGRGKRDHEHRPSAPHHGRRTRSACICFSVITYMLVTPPT